MSACCPRAPSDWYQLKRGIALRQFAKSLNRRTRRNRKVALHLAPEIIQIGLQDLGLVRIRNRSQPKPLLHPSLLQRHLSRGFRIAHPLRPPARSHQEPLASKFQQIDRSGVELSAFAAAHLQKIIVGKTESKPDQESKDPVEHTLDSRRRTKFRQWGA